MEDMTLNNSAANAEVNMNESTSVNENVSVGTDTPTVLPESPVIGFQAVDAEGNVLGFVSKAELVNEAKQALYADLAILEANRPTTLPANDMLADTSTLAATDVYEDQLAIKSDAPYIRGLDASGNPIRISKADLASVVGGLIGRVGKNQLGLIDKSKDFFWVGPISSEKDFNDITQPGMYNLNGTKSSPNTPLIDYGIMCIFASGGQIMQLCANVFIEQYRIRTRRDNGTWTLWKTIALSV